MIDTAFDFRWDTRPGRDPDSDSPTLHRYHRLLWSRPLPSGAPFDLADGRPLEYLTHRSELGEFFLSSDAVVPTFEHKASAVVAQLPRSDFDHFYSLGYTIGGMMIFPSNKIDGKMTINGARGLHPRIADRFDLTVECTRRHYLGLDSPLSAVLSRYREFFDLFGDFAGYVDHFLLQDLVNDDATAVQVSMPFDDFTTPAVPYDVSTYVEYRRRCINFLNARNGRIAELASLILRGPHGAATGRL